MLSLFWYLSLRVQCLCIQSTTPWEGAALIISWSAAEKSDGQPCLSLQQKISRLSPERFRISLGHGAGWCTLGRLIRFFSP